MRAGRKLHEQIDEAISVYEKLILVLSANSMDSEWVRTEIAKCLPSRGAREHPRPVSNLAHPICGNQQVAMS